MPEAGENDTGMVESGPPARVDRTRGRSRQPSAVGRGEAFVRDRVALIASQPRTGAAIRHSVKTLEMAEKVMDCVVRGLSVSETARELGVQRTRAQQLIDFAIENRRQALEGKGEEVRTVVLARLDEAIKQLWKLARPEDGSKPNAYAIKTIVDLEARRAALLGLDAPVKQETTLNINQNSDAELLSSAGAFGIQLGAFAAGAALAGAAAGAGAAARAVPEPGRGGQPALGAGLPAIRDDQLAADAPAVSPHRGGLAVGAGEDAGAGI